MSCVMCSTFDGKTILTYGLGYVMVLNTLTSLIWMNIILPWKKSQIHVSLNWLKGRKIKRYWSPHSALLVPYFSKPFCSVPLWCLWRRVDGILQRVICLNSEIFQIPWEARNSWAMWAGQSTQRPMLMIKLVDETVSMVSPKNKDNHEGQW